MARIIDFHVPAKFQKKEKPIPQSHKGKVIEFSSRSKKSA
jgi:hypothetical protein